MPLSPASANVLFITEKNIKDLGLISQNVDSALLNPIIKMTQETELNRLLGTGLYVHIQNAVLGNTLTTDELFLLNVYIQPVLIWGTMMNLPVFLSYRFANAGIVRVQGDNSALPSLAEINAVKDEAKGYFGYYSDLLIRHIIANSTLFASYNQNSSIEDSMPSTSGFKNPFYTGDCGLVNWEKKRKYFHSRMFW